MGRGAVRQRHQNRALGFRNSDTKEWWAVLDSNQIDNGFRVFRAGASRCRTNLNSLLSSHWRVPFRLTGHHTSAGQQLPGCCPEGRMAAKVKLTDRKLKSLKPARAGERDELMDAELNGFGVRVTDKGKITFILLSRYPGSNNPTRRALGEYPTDTLADAREKARQWRKWIEKGIDPQGRGRASATRGAAQEGRYLRRSRRGIYQASPPTPEAWPHRCKGTP